MVDSPRILELRRRVQADPASIAFAQLAEDCRRAGDATEAVVICRAGLAHHPGYLSARVTLGRALLEVGRLDEAATELTTVVQAAPTNLPAIRGLAEIHQQRGEMLQALAHYQRALQLAQFDPDLEDSVERLSRVVAPAPALTSPSAVKVEALFDFDSLLKQLGETAPLRERAPLAPPAIAASAIDAVDLQQQPPDGFADVERDLRARAEHRAAEERAERERAERLAAEERAEADCRAAEQRIADERAADEHAKQQAARDQADRHAAEEQAARVQLAARRESAVVGELEQWLAAIEADRHSVPPDAAGSR